MGFRKKTSHALKTLFFGGVKALVEYRIAKFEKDKADIEQKLDAHRTLEKYAEQAFDMVEYDYDEVRRRPRRSDSLH